ncbi:type 2 isopentenyl-diphosphate Delta-isomerase [Niallia circulans]|uniref:Isopentenyl-diphosphate delta-isomerase n=1 Tax=Niallia circulans TaxID=1397 RepID=A0A553SMD6_NIACI|nr:type 2 isopentenyl-diphosphate Delta-isomerase [Niallia circulans]TRZ38138.1 type 2 isopentenyl-diphosphate Delta-isomerase [Niallia circulans]
MSENKRQKRKDEHIELALQSEHALTSDFDELTFIHRSLPEVSILDIDLSTSIGPLAMEFPLYINAMTGGSTKSAAINAALAKAANAAGLPMAVGSQHAGIRDAELANSYKVVRTNNPNGLIFANVGADVPLEFARKAIDMLEADALQVHLNVPQELVMPEGERDFSGMLAKLEKLVSKLSVPLIVKETGFGMSVETIAQLKGIGINYIDIGGRGGTNFVHIENERRSKKDYSYLKGWGHSTAISLLEAKPVAEGLTIMASGGIRNPLDAAKCFSLGASAAGIAGPFLKILHEFGTEGLIEELEEWKQHLQIIFLLLGVKSINDLQKYPIVTGGKLKNWCEVRGIDILSLARRTIQ